VGSAAGQTERPAAASLLRGKTPDEAAALVPRLFSLCGKAQQAVCVAACAVAGGLPGKPSPAVRRALLAEAGQEHLWRLLLDWPRLLGAPAAEVGFARWHRRLAAWARETADAGGGTASGDEGPRATDPDVQTAAALAGFLQDEVLGVSVADFLAGQLPAAGALAGRLLAALPPLSHCATPLPERPRLLPHRAAHDWARDPALADGGFARAPVWDGAPAETGALARQQARPAVAGALADGQGVRARLLARLCDLAELPARLAADSAGVAAAAAGGVLVRLDAASVQPGGGLACTDTARGLLIHQVRLAAGRIADYRVIAPSEWNFHPAGRWRRELDGLPASTPQEAEARARQLVLALDPCVPLHLELNATENHDA